MTPPQNQLLRIKSTIIFHTSNLNSRKQRFLIFLAITNFFIINPLYYSFPKKNLDDKEIFDNKNFSFSEEEK